MMRVLVMSLAFITLLVVVHTPIPLYDTEGFAVDGSVQKSLVPADAGGLSLTSLSPFLCQRKANPTEVAEPSPPFK
jgi:hypothetical protein